MGFDWGTLASCLCTVNLAVLGWIVTRVGRIEEKLDGKLSKEECKTCAADHEKGLDALWKAHGRHSHTGLELDSRVIR